MSIFKRKPKLRSGIVRSAKLYQSDDDYIQSAITAGRYKTMSDALIEYVHIGVRVERNTDLGKDETMYAVVKKQEMVVHEGTKYLAETIVAVDQHVREEMAQNKALLAGLSERLAQVERQTAQHTNIANRLLEISIICYGILRHYVLGLFVVRLTKTPFENYAAGFGKRLNIFKANIRAGNILLEGEYERAAEEFSLGLTEATGVTVPKTNAEQVATQATQTSIVKNPFDVPKGFPAE